ncbi:MAG TPA: DUF6489 family protein [Acetobacteraceae bacterium]|nr:DUF6489 family protein [Acetobacteraceae bacterium]
MKINIEIDCTPEEAREFLGLPDVKPMQAAVMERLQAQTLEAMGHLDPASLRSWLPLWGLGSEFAQKMMQGFLEASTRPRTERGGEAGKE